MNNNYKFIHSILIKNGTNHRIQLAKASDFGGSEEEFRIYYNRRWLDGFYTNEGLANLVNSIFNNKSIDKPALQKGDKVKWFYQKYDREVCEMGFIKDDPIHTFEGAWLYPVILYGRIEYINANELTLVT